MTKNQELTLFKFLAVGAALLYLYKLTKAEGGTLQGKINPENIANLGSHLFPKEYRPHAKAMGRVVLNRLMEQ